jgi:glycosyltransferase involved in cell wall biosynthesis
MLKAKNTIDISVVIPAYNEQELLPLCLKSLQNQDFKGSYEIIVVDNNSTDKTSQIAKKLGVRVIKERKRGIAFARQAGFEAARGKITASTDADTVPNLDWLKIIWQTYQKNKNISAITGPIDFFGQTKRRLFLVNIFSPVTRFFGWMFTAKSHIWGANFAIKRSVFEKIGGFDTRLAIGEDYDLGTHAKEFGKILLIKNLRVKTSARKWEQQMSSAKGIKNLFSIYFLNFFWLLFFKEPKINKFNNIRTQGINKVISSKSVIKTRAISYTTIIIVVILIILTLGIFSPRNQLFGRVYWHKNTHEKIIALTFDDGPNEPYTSEILDILDQYNIKATFFTIGQNVQYYPETIKEMYDAGHVVANHSYSHLGDLSFEDKKTIDEEIDKSQNLIYQIIGQYPHLFRPPHGYKSPTLLGEIKKKQLITVECQI